MLLTGPGWGGHAEPLPRALLASLNPRWAPSLLTGNRWARPPAVSLDCGLLMDVSERNPSPGPWSKEKAAFVGCPASWKAITRLSLALRPQRPPCQHILILASALKTHIEAL